MTTGVPLTYVSSSIETAPTEEVRTPANCLREISSSFQENSYALGRLVPVRSSWNWCQMKRFHASDRKS